MIKSIKRHFILPDAKIEIHYNYFDAEIADQYFNHLLDNINWKQELMNLYGNEVKFARLMSWYGESGKSYKFSGKTQTPNDWSNEKILLDIKREIEGLYNENLNSVLLNKYRSESDSITWHSDDEKELGDEPSIYSLSLGCEREFKLKHKYGKEFINPSSENASTVQGDLFNQENNGEDKLVKVL